MSRKPNPALKKGGIYQSQIDWGKEHPKDKLILRMPQGKREVINQYVEKKAMANPNDRKYSTDKGRPSVNAYVNALIEEDMKNNP